jgi:hypothetical protein
MPIDFDAVWDAWLDTPGHETCPGFRITSAGQVRCACGGVVPYAPAGPGPATLGPAGPPEGAAA